VKAGFALLLVFTPACFWATTKHEGKVMREQIKSIDGRLANQEKVLEGRVKQLDESIDKATKILARNSADLGTQVDKFSEELAAHTGRLEALTRTLDQARAELAQVKTTQADITARLENIERQLGIRPGVPGQPTNLPPVDKNTVYDGAVAKLQAGQLADARREFRLYVQAFPQDDRADNAAYFVGETFAKEKEYANAIAEFQRVVDTYPKGDVVDDAFLAAGLAALDGKLCLEAQAYLGELIRRFPTSALKNPAKQKLDYLKKNRKNEKVCKP
jgi:tol-pal system protein YbgF